MAHNAYIFRYRVRNWRTYNQALIDRGGITFWIDEAALTTWRNTQARLGPGAPRIYSDTAIQLRGGRQERLLPQRAGRSRFCILGAESDETRPTGAEL